MREKKNGWFIQPLGQQKARENGTSGGKVSWGKRDDERKKKKVVAVR